MFELKQIAREGIDRALAKAERYRLLNEPRDAESICRDVLRVSPDHQAALVTMLLALTDQFGHDARVNVGHARELLPRIADEYTRVYLEGVICERWAKAQFGSGAPGYAIYDWFEQAMNLFERADVLCRDDDDEDAKLRWNACARMVKRQEHVRPRSEDTASVEAIGQDDVPV